MAADEPDATMIITAAGTIHSSTDNWGRDKDEVLSDVWRILREGKHLMTSGEALKRIVVSFVGYDYVITGKDGQYHVVRWRRSGRTPA
mmetsp:Transcript_55317/g.86041  ORF Transcript_55317/g.86041 Transcript_55317/m.86041 type:complete len:88 (-) Transcript_55317:12-275(-)